MPDALDQGMTPEERTLFERIRRDPTAARLAVAEHVAWYQDPDTIWEWEPPAVDVPILARPDVREALTLMFREGARQGVGGLVDDWIALSLPWGLDLAEVQMPVVVCHSDILGAITARAETKDPTANRGEHGGRVTPQYDHLSGDHRAPQRDDASVVRRPGSS